MLLATPYSFLDSVKTLTGSQKVSAPNTTGVNSRARATMCKMIPQVFYHLKKTIGGR